MSEAPKCPKCGAKMTVGLDDQPYCTWGCEPPTPSERIAELESKLAAAEARAEDMKSRNAILREERNAANARYQSLTAANAALERQLKDAKIKLGHMEIHFADATEELKAHVDALAAAQSARDTARAQQAEAKEAK